MLETYEGHYIQQLFGNGVGKYMGPKVCLIYTLSVIHLHGFFNFVTQVNKVASDD